MRRLCAAAAAVAIACLAGTALAQGEPAAAPPPPTEPITPAPSSTSAPLPAAPPTADVAKTPPELKHAWALPYYDQGFVLVSIPESYGMPFELKLNHVSQFKYTNTVGVHHTYTDHLGNEHDVLRRNDVQLTRDVFYFSGFVFDRNLDFNILVYTSSADLTASAAGYIGYVFNKMIALRAGFFSLPSVRSFTGNYPFFQGTDRSMATNYFRPGFTQGVWINGELLPHINYIAMIGNSLNTLNIAANKIDFNFAYSASVWFDWNDFGKDWIDYVHHQSPSLRIGTAFTFAREDRLSDLAVESPENNSTYMSDGQLLFGTGTLAPGVTVSLDNFYLWAIDGGIKYRGLAFNTEFYLRWLNDFTADGPLPISSMFDWGFDASLGYFVARSAQPYIRSSFVRGPFATAVEGAVGAQLFPFHTRQAWFALEVIGIKNSPYQSVLYVYSSGQTGVLVPAEFILRF